MLIVEQLKVHGLAPISFRLAKGDLLVVRGPSGCGKSLLLRAIADLDEAAGEISLVGQSRDDMPAADWRRKVRFVAAESGWWLERAGEHFSNLGKARELAAKLGLAAKLFEAPVSRLSSGERQRMAFVRALEDNPPVLLLDEPASALDDRSANLLEEQVERLQGEGKIIILVTHSERQGKKLATHFLTINKGRAEFSST